MKDLTITLDFLASSSAGLGRQSTFVESPPGSRLGRVELTFAVGPDPRDSGAVYVWLLEAAKWPLGPHDSACDFSRPGLDIRSLGRVGVAGRQSGEFVTVELEVPEVRGPWAIGVLNDTGTFFRPHSRVRYEEGPLPGQ